MKNVDIESNESMSRIVFYLLLVLYTCTALFLISSLNVINGFSGYIWGSWSAYIVDGTKVVVLLGTLWILAFKKKYRNSHFLFIFSLALLMFSVIGVVSYT